ncbi:carboxypeptidase D-like [Actinia tenebrosa]|uniref:Carboxypeptidase D-like n=1 Tax=Actinia tenebrosa TaxID=6105 RepID=A0A6P8HTX3_ACTTE|nr:carboxypeptidase D-like [Actinia tenebrosa]
MRCLKVLALVLCVHALTTFAKPPASLSKKSSAKVVKKSPTKSPIQHLAPVKPELKAKVRAVKQKVTAVKQQKHVVHEQKAAKEIPTKVVPKIKVEEIHEKNSSFRHHNYEEMTWLLKEFARKHQDIARLYDIGKSVQNRKLWVMEISDNPGKHEAEEPEVKYVANIHGNEVIGKEMLLHLIRYLCHNYGINKRVTNIVDATRIHILPSMNPDGYEMAATDDDHQAGSKNANDIDLNRNFPDQFFPSTTGPPQPETHAVMKWVRSNPFVLSASLHAGALVASYPYDDNPSGKTSYSASPDDDVFREVARAYSQAHPTMHLANAPWKCKNKQKEHFIDGITNGADWFSLSGGMQDYNYVHSNCFEVTLELGCEKFPNATALPEYWRENKEALLSFVEQANKGIHGIIQDEDDKPIKDARINIANRPHDVFTSNKGDYWRLLVPGSYEVTVSAKGYEHESKTATVHSSAATKLDFTLRRIRERKPRHIEDNEDPRGSFTLRRSLRDFYRDESPDQKKQNYDGDDDNDYGARRQVLD